MKVESKLVFAGCLLSLLIAKPARIKASSWAVGPLADTSPGLSVQYMKSEESAYHIAAHFAGRQSFIITGDLQRFYLPSIESVADTATLGLYTGIGLRGETTNEAPSRELYAGRWPFGCQADWRDLPMQTFIEYAVLIGPLPRTGFASSVRAGLRAKF